LDGEPETTTQEVIAEAEMTDPAGLTRRVSFDSGHWVADTVEAGGEELTVRAERDPDTGFVTAIETPDAASTSYEYDSAGRPVRLVETDGDGQERAYHLAYDPDTHELVSFTDPDGTVHTYTRDEAGNLVGQETAGGPAVGYTYDDHGRLTSITDQGGHTTRIDYELAHRVTVTDPHGNTYREFLDAAGRLVAVTDTAGATTRIGYDEQGLPVTLIDPVGGQVHFRYDADGNPAALTDAAGNTTTYEVDDRGLMTTRTDASGASERFAYDDAGRMVSHVDRRGIRTDVRHDAFDRLIEVAYGVDDNDEAASTVRLRYDAANRLVEVVDSAYGTIGFDYDGHSQLIRESTPDGDITYAYDSVGRRVGMTLPDGTETRYGYDAAGFLTSVDRGDAEVRATRDPRGVLQRLELPGGLAADYRVDERGLVRGIDYQHTAADVAADLQYGYDAAGRQVSVAGSLAGAELPPAAGPREYGPANRLIRDGDTSYVYDEAGNLVDDGVHTYTWDERGQLVAVDGPVSVRFAYDPFGRRTSKTVDGVTTTYTYDGQNLVALGGDGPAVTYLTGLGLDEVFARVDAGGVHSYLTDTRGSVVAVADQEGTLRTRYRYDPYGVTTASGAPEPGGVGFTGRERDETGLHYHRHRYYQPELGRFISEDPLGFHAGDPNLYAYTFGDPVNYVDPDGRQAVGVGVGVCIAALGVAFGVAMDAWDDMMEIMDPDRGPRFGTEEAQIALDRINRRLQMTMDAWVTICSVSMGFSLPGFGGLATRGVGSFGRGLPTLGQRPGVATRPPGAPPTAAQAGAGPRPTPRAGCSFDADTLVLLADGAWVPISQIEIGDRVLAADPVTGEQDAREVTHTWVHDDTLVDLVVGVDDDAGDGPAGAAAVSAVTTTADHPFWSETSDAWLPAQELTPGEQLLTADGDTVAVVGLDHDSARIDVAYDLTVDSLHSYYVLAGETPVLVHNCGTAAEGWANRADFSNKSTLSAKYDAHAADFGLTGNRNNANLSAFQQTMTQHMTAPGTKIFRFDYRGQGQAIGFIDPATNRMVMLHADTGKFWTAYRLGDNQFMDIVQNGRLW
jgi:RHS repeat-associated protein